MGKLFGTDGIRGVANEYPMTAEMALNVGRAVASLFRKQGSKSKIVIGKDTRVSGYMLEYAMASGICSTGGDAYLAGTLPTPGIAFMTSSAGADAGVVISASHNPFYDNGIKIFKNDGYKLSDEKEAEIEQLLSDDNLASLCCSAQETGKVYKIEDARKRYITFLKQAVPGESPFSGMKIILDCSNGATYRVGPEIFTQLGANVEALFVSPDGKNINENCGSQHTETLQKKVTEQGADIGLAFDGDGDRLIAIDDKGNIVTGDQILAICAKSMKTKGLLKNNLVVCTVMSNIGFKLALKEMGINHIMADVGDRYVLQEMRGSGAVIGGEDSGHMIFSDHHTTGDGILTALKLIQAMKEESKPLSELGKIMTTFPQILMNVEVKNKPEIETVPDIVNEIKSVENHLGEKGRVLVRYSGTQPLCRVMVEGPTHEETERYCRQIVDVVQEKLGT
ncbi:phosphoglucosamine mutase [Desulfonema magnum]|uniref:Phosphoglucosamine mutase n=1 Tax=Desulfonema magnum TaxID=45655 RepID=A0A975GSY4_9BACT|nr:phosphoglucosamine mutase [Desulfonema magnum]QTA92519.1 Phosphoglucosamine mutase [Desulfonema magnum]